MLRPPAALEDIEQTLQHFATEDVRELYLQLDGFADHAYCQNQFCLWSLETVRAENDINPTQIIWFADFLIFSHQYGFKPETPQVSSVHLIYNDDLNETRKLADSVAEFLHLLVHDPISIELLPITSESPRPPNLLERLGAWWRGRA